MGMLQQLLGNERVKASLMEALQGNHLPHSILLVGEQGCGTGFAARCLAADYLYPEGGPEAEAVMNGDISMAVAAEGGDSEGRVLTGRAREVIGVRGEGAQGEIKVSAVRALRDEMYSTALTGAGRAAILYNCQNLNGASGNAMLKTLEEPPANTLFILTANTDAAVLATIRSRCSRYTLAPVSEEECTRYLQRHFPEQKNPQQLSQAFGGSIGRCVKVCRDPDSAALLSDAQQLARLTAAGREYEILCLLSAYENKERMQLRSLLDYLICVCSAALHGSTEYGLSRHKAAGAIRCAENTARQVRRNANSKLALTLLGAELAALAD